MKSQLALNRIGLCVCIVAVVVITLSLSGCKTTTQPVMIPVTDDVIREIQNIQDTSIDNFQYYISKTILLTLANPGAVSLETDHVLVRTATPPRDTITIAAFTRGKLLSQQIGNTISVSFEKDQVSLVISFHRVTGNDRYEIDIGQTGIINYGGNNYSVDFNRVGEPPYLMIMMREKVDREDQKRSVEGWPL